MSFIKVIQPDSAKGRLDKLYSMVSGPGGQVDHVLQIHSLRPHSLEGHMSLYKAVLHHPRNKLPKWFLEMVGVYVSKLNQCAYCVRHHSVGLKRALAGEPGRYEEIMSELNSPEPGGSFTGAEKEALAYVRKLTENPSTVTNADVKRMRSVGLRDGEILEINQVTAYFAYANRTVLGLGVSIEGEQLGLSPADDINWHHE